MPTTNNTPDSPYQPPDENAPKPTEVPGKRPQEVPSDQRPMEIPQVDIPEQRDEDHHTDH